MLDGLVCFTGGGGKTTSMLRLAGRFGRGGGVIVTSTTRMAASEVELSEVLLTENFSSIYSPDFLSGVKDMIEARGRVFLFRRQDGEKGENGEKCIGLPPETVSSLYGMNLARWVLVEADGAMRMPLKGYAGHEPPLPADFGCQVIVVGADALSRPMNEVTTARFEILRRFLGVESNAPLTPPLLLKLLTSPQMYLKNSPPGVRRVLCLNKADLAPPEALAPWVDYLLPRLSMYCGIWVTGGRGQEKWQEKFYARGAV
jgi:probable selenium-dependent hydroxylase accessory protein YqeC